MKAERKGGQQRKGSTYRAIQRKKQEGRETADGRWKVVTQLVEKVPKDKMA
jgi:hypothetical protein